ncbi:AraC family transcriptional regulator [bacterium]|nr:MAG: AraC family transcriptional regulator [bacterium]
MRRTRNQASFGRPHTVSPVLQVYRMFSPNGMPKGHEPHYHPDSIEVCYVARGHLDWWVASEACEVHSGDVIVIPPGVPHGSVDSTLQPCEYFALHIAPEELSPTLAEVAAGLGGRYARRSEVGELVRRVFIEHGEEPPCLPEIGSALATLLLTGLAGRPDSASDSRNATLVSQAQALLDPLGDQRTVEEVADRLGVSSVWLNRAFANELGVTPGEWARSRRLAEAKRLLALERSSVLEVAIHLGFKSSQYFATAFRHECGMTPSAYRARCAPTGSIGTSAPVCAPISRTE